MTQHMRSLNTQAPVSNENILNCYFDQHSGIVSSNIVSSLQGSSRQNADLNNSPGTI